MDRLKVQLLYSYGKSKKWNFSYKNLSPPSFNQIYQTITDIINIIDILHTKIKSKYL